MTKKILLVVDWRIEEMEFVSAKNIDRAGNYDIEIWNCRRKTVVVNAFIQRYLEYLLAVKHILLNHKRYHVIAIWQQLAIRGAGFTGTV